jgi:oligopeptide transport system substrate-binding protein
MKLIPRIIVLLLTLAIYGISYAQDETTAPDVPLSLALIGTPGRLDPLVVTNAADIHLVNNLFIGLTRLDPITGEILPALATAWEVSADGKTWTFTLRDDVPWVTYNPLENTFSVSRMVTADDVLFAFRRVCSGAAAGYYALDVFAVKIAGCDTGQQSGTAALLQAQAPDPTTFVITLNEPYGYFLAMTAMWTIRPLPEETLKFYANNWLDPGNIVISGAYALAENSETTVTLLKNPFYPADLWNGGNITRIEMTIVEDVFGQFARYRRNLLDMTDIPLRDLEGVQEDAAFAPELLQINEQVVFYFGFAHDKAPFDDVHVRRAFAAAFDRAAFVSDTLRGNGTPIAHFTPPGLAHAPDLNAAFDLAFDPEFARAELTLSPYPDCAGLPDITITTFDGAYRWAEFLVNSAAEHLGCDPEKFTLEEIRLGEVQAKINPALPADQRPHLFTLGWGPDYADADSFSTVLACGANNPLKRDCDAVDDLILQARIENDTAVRTRLYDQIEQAFFGTDGQFPILPLYLSSVWRLKKAWFTGPFATDGRFGGIHYDAYTVNPELLAEGRVVCNIVGLGNANLRFGPSTTTELAGRITLNQVIRATSQTTGQDNYRWWLLETGAWAREDVVGEEGDCDRLPQAFAETGS